MKKVSETPEVWLVDDLVDPETLAAIRAVAHDTPRAEADGWEVTHSQHGRSLEIPIEGSAALEALRATIEGLMGMENDIPWTFRYRRYLPGEGHPPHLDCYPFEDRELIATALLYLGATESGGETEFPHAELAITPRPGRLIFWYNHTPDGAPDPLSRHLGRPVLAGEKEVLVWLVYKHVEAAAIRPVSPVVSA